MARLIKDLPPKLLTMEKSFNQLLRLLQDPSLAVQISSYDLLQRVVRKHVEDLVVEVELDAEEKVEIGLPRSLISLLEAKLDVDEIESEEKVSFLSLSNSAGIKLILSLLRRQGISCHGLLLSHSSVQL